MPSAPNARFRDGGVQDHEQRKERYPEALGGQPDFPGKHLPETGYTGGSTAAKKELGVGGREYHATSTTSSGGATPTAPAATDTYTNIGGTGGEGRDINAGASGSRYYGGEAPNYVLPVVNDLSDKKPKGNNISEGGFDSDDRKNASWNTDIGTNDDPGRVAENKYQRSAVESGLDAARPKEANVEGGSNHWYSPLDSDQRV